MDLDELDNDELDFDLSYKSDDDDVDFDMRKEVSVVTSLIIAHILVHSHWTLISSLSPITRRRRTCPLWPASSALTIPSNARTI